MNAQRLGTVVQVEKSLVFGGALLAVILQTMALGGIVWKGAQWSERLEYHQDAIIEKEKQHDAVLERTVNALSALERRVYDLESKRR